MALGAQRDQLLQLMLFDGPLGLGLLLSFAATRIFQSMLSGTRPLDPVVLSGVWMEKLDIVPLPPHASEHRKIAIAKTMHGGCSTCY